jgi:hypothetical protein
VKSPFQIMLAQAAKLAAADDALTNALRCGDATHLIQRGDAAHLKRWAKDTRAAEIYDKIFDGKFYYPPAFLFMSAVLGIRHLAEFEAFTSEAFALIDRAQKRRLPKDIREGHKALADEQITPEEFATYREEMTRIVTGGKYKRKYPWLEIREKPTRKKMIFCRALSLGLHRAKGRWHDAEVAALCEIAFGLRDVSTDVVRASRKRLTP